MNPILISIGDIKIYWYSFILLVAFTLGFYLFYREAIKEKIDKNFIIDYACYLIPICLIGARIYYVIFEFQYYQSDLLGIFRVWEGGLAIHGGIIAGAIFTLYYSKKHNVNFYELADILVISLIIGQIIGRWGNFLNSEAYGPQTTYTFLKSLHLPEFIIKGMCIDGVYYHPTFLYESLWNLIGLFILLIIKRYRKHKGTLLAIYLIYYGIGRFLIESLRQDSLMLFNIKMAQFASIGMILIGIFILIKESKKAEKPVKK